MPTTRSYFIRHLLYCFFSLAAGLLAPSAGAQTQTYPDKPITLVIPFTPGGGTDIVAKTVSQKLEAALGQPLVMEHRPGANGIIANQYVARKEADGYTLLLAGLTT